MKVHKLDILILISGGVTAEEDKNGRKERYLNSAKLSLDSRELNELPLNDRINSNTFFLSLSLFFSLSWNGKKKILGIFATFIIVFVLFTPLIIKQRNRKILSPIFCNFCLE